MRVAVCVCLFSPPLSPATGLREDQSSESAVWLLLKLIATCDVCLTILRLVTVVAGVSHASTVQAVAAAGSVCSGLAVAFSHVPSSAPRFVDALHALRTTAVGWWGISGTSLPLIVTNTSTESLHFTR